MDENNFLYINKKLRGQDVEAPKTLYKYRPFDDYTFDMLDNKYLYLCPAQNLDDPSECRVVGSVNDFIKIDTTYLNYCCINLILEGFNKNISAQAFQNVEKIVYRIVNNGRVRNNLLLQHVDELEKYLPKPKCIELINQLVSIPQRIDEPNIRAQIEELFVGAYKAREEMGICSLSMLANDDEMWKNYANNYSGYCIEFDMSNYEFEDALFPVIYDDERSNDIIRTIVLDFISKLIGGINNDTHSDISNYVRMFLTKASKWEYQKEWRIIGNGNTKIQAPNIKAVYLGKEVTDINRQKMLEYCELNNIECVEK